MAPPQPRELSGNRLVEAPAPGREQVEGSGRVNELDGPEDRLRSEHHARAATEGRVVHRAMWVGRAGAQIVNAEVDEPVAPGPADDAGRAVGVHDFGKDREDVYAQRRRAPSPPASAGVAAEAGDLASVTRTAPPAHRPRGATLTADHESQRYEVPVLHHEQITRRVCLHGDHGPASGPVDLHDLASDQVVDEQCLRVLDRGAASRAPRSSSAASRV